MIQEACSIPQRASFISEEELQDFSWPVLNDFYPDGVPLPIPVEEIAEQHYKIHLEFEELKPHILGFSDFAAMKIWINSCLLEQGEDRRLRFTIAHELGHYSCHFRYLHGKGILYSKSLKFYENNYSRLEIQANIFAGCLLMPKYFVLKKWREMTGSDDPYSLEEENKRHEEHQKKRGFLDFSFDFKAQRFTQDIAETFEVSFQCAQIQLKKLGLLFECPYV